jgi:hypothetical protein
VRRWIAARFRALRRSLISPSVKQKEAYARYCHTLSAAALIGAMTLFFSDSPLTASSATRGGTLLVFSVILFLFGPLFTEED